MAMATLMAASLQLPEDERALLVIRMNSPHPAHWRLVINIRRICADLLAFGAPCADWLTHMLTGATLLQHVIAQYRRHRARAMAQHLATAYRSGVCTTEVRTGRGGFKKVLPCAMGG
jgi:hypothetical protein